MATETIRGASWVELGFTTLTKNVGKEYSTCPQCSHTRKKTRHKCVTVIHTADKFENTAYCGQCYTFFVVGDKKHSDFNKDNYKPALHTQSEKVYDIPKMPLLPSETDSNLQRMYKYFAERKISKATLQAMQVQTTNVWIQGNSIEIDKKVITTVDGVQNTISFPYFRNSELVNIKYRSATKAFRLEKNAELILYNFDVLYTDIKTLIITEGEIDCLSFLECGITNVVSVPNGAAKNANLSYLDNASELLSQIDTFIIATDNDKAGELLAEELIRRLGREKCKRVVFYEGCKDPNEVLCKFGKEKVLSIVENALELNIKGIVPKESISRDVLALYNQGKPQVYTTGIHNLDDLFKLRLGEYTVISGVPNKGKSTVAEELLQRYNYYHDLKVGILSFENTYDFQSAFMLQRAFGKPFFEPNQYQTHLQRISLDEVTKGIEYLNENFKFFDCRATDDNGNDLDEYDIDNMVKKAKECHKKYGTKIFFFDPFNYIDKSKKPKSYATDGEYITYINKCLSKLAKTLNVHIILIAHPTQNVTDKYTYIDAKGQEQTMLVAGANNIAGSASFYAAADNIIIIDQHPVTLQTIFMTKKIKKQQFVGKKGDCLINFDVNKQQYFEDNGISDMPNYRAKIYKTQIEQPQNDTTTAFSYAANFENSNSRDLPF
jgi:twinkle protein